MHTPVQVDNSITKDEQLHILDFQAEEIEVSVVMPCLNEAETIEVCVRKATTALARAHLRGEVIVADNGSTDGSQAIAQRAGGFVIPVTERGYGAALRTGFLAARGKYIIMADSDGSYDFDLIPAFVEKLRDGYDLVMGTRLKGTIMPGAMPFLHQYLGNPVLTFLGNLVIGSSVSDYHCGMRGMNAAAVRKLGLVTSGMEMATEMVVRFTLQGRKITEIPITLYPDGRTRKPHLRTWRDGWRHVKIYLLFSPNWLFFLPATIFLILGVGIYVSQLLHASSTDVAYFVAFGATVVAIELFILGLFARFYLYKNGITVRDRLSNWITTRLNLNYSLLATMIVSFVGLAISMAFLSNLPILIIGLVIFTLGINLLLGSLLAGLLNLDHHFR